MRLFLKFILFACLVFTTISCGSDKVDQNQMLRDEVITIHDEVMPHMGELKSLRKKIDSKANSLEEEDTVANSEKILELRLLAKDLDDAFDGMFVWMRQFKSSNEGMTDEELNSYLNEQKIMVTKVNDDINNSMARAKNELQNE
ncbi:hypothetical protein MM213_09265 [Belliella sp. R4-6]|uniref:Viral A-type inclusion protein n=1 Tax=Belliella alkalica TaxID=1730871 RepID=A0ABS9VB62_9BACT|nr:hypothetical protein [Belliella alkalica]MCH7413673.1 hypothetical protein [Belliella alkalica]